MIEGSASPYRVTVGMTYETAAVLLERGKALLGRGEEVAFDLAAVQAVDSSALSVILGWQRAVAPRRLAITNPPASIRSLAALYGIDDFLA
jgi:phospholipid transport system transporter-binding protein